MRGPGDAQGSFALESALDELAYKLNIDPIELRLINYAEVDPESNLPWSSKALRECYQKGAERIGWNERNPQPRSMSENGMLIGYGMATATYPMNWRESVAKVKVLQDGTAIVQSAASDMGPGTYTAMTTIASEFLGIPSDRIKFELGNTNFPSAAVHGGSTTATSVGSAVKAACEKVRDSALIMLQETNSIFTGNQSKDIEAKDGRIFLKQNPSQGISYTEILTQANRESIEAEATSKPTENPKYSLHSFGAQFVEVRVDEVFGNVRVSRVVSAVDIGRVINPKTAKSQVIGGAVGGIGMALQEQTYMDSRFGNYVNGSLAEYLVPVNADIQEIEAIFCGEPDYNANPLGARGIGEIAIVGIAPVIANAVYHATGKRIRDLPITLDKLF
ncbi:MAG: molybdopterin-dependent oxidoreductase [Pleurocapsa sp. MO_192.B19]|nr:molybdopterin-dependent oxidoreductase [Pleurocapsa sp. MO_192.B19]